MRMINSTRILLLWSVLFLTGGDGLHAEVKTWRVGDAQQPWQFAPVSGLLSWGRGWGVEVLIDEDGDGRIDEDPVELVDEDEDGLINEDPPDGFDNDVDGLIDEDGPDPQVDNDGDGQLNEDGLMTFTDDDYDGRINEDPVDGVDNDEDGLIDEDGYGMMTDRDDDCTRDENNVWNPSGLCDGGNEDPVDGFDNDGDGLIDEDGSQLPDGIGVTTWISPIRLHETRDMAPLIVGRQLRAEYGDGFMAVPTEGPFRRDNSTPISPNKLGGGATLEIFSTYARVVDGDIFTAFGNRIPSAGSGFGLNLMGSFFLNRITLRPRPTLPDATPRDYLINYGDRNDVRFENQRTSEILLPLRNGEFQPVVKDLRFDPPVEMTSLYFDARHPNNVYWELSEIGVFGDGYAMDASYTSEIIDVGVPTPRFRRYELQRNRYKLDQRDQVEAQFPELDGDLVTWGRVRWKGRRLGEKGNMRIQFRVGNSLDIHVYQRKLGPGLADIRDENGEILDSFGWAKLDGLVRVNEEVLPYNEIGLKERGADKALGWTFWSAPFRFEDGLIDESRPQEESGILLPLPGQTRYMQFRIWFDSEQHSAVSLDYIEFEYDVPVVGEGVLAEVFPAEVELGEEEIFRYYIKPLFAGNDRSGFNRLEIVVPSENSQVQEFKVDGQAWVEIPVSATDGTDPLLAVNPERLEPTEGGVDSLGQFAQNLIRDPETGTKKLQLKFPLLTADDFPPGEGRDIEINFTSTLFNGSTQLTSSVWNDANQTIGSFIPQPTSPGDASSELITNQVNVVARVIGDLIDAPQVTPNPFTPNGDGINDQAVFSFNLFLVTQPVEILVDICDLSGRVVHTLGPVMHGAGAVNLTWNGRNTENKVLPPGIYLYRLKANDVKEFKEQIGSVALVY